MWFEKSIEVLLLCGVSQLLSYNSLMSRSE